MTVNYRLAALLAIVVTSAALPLSAQTPPPHVDPGVVQRRFRIPPLPKSSTEQVVPAPAQLEPPADAENIHFTLRTVKVSSALPDHPALEFTEAELAPIWADRVGQRVSVADVYRFAAAITVRYRNAGYVLSRAIVPPQDLTHGDLELSVSEGFIDEVLLEGDVERPSFWDAQVERIKASRPLHESVLERAVLLLNDLPGAGVRAVLRPSPRTAGASELVLLSDQRPLFAFAEVNNRGTRLLGPFQGELGVTLNSLLNIYDQTEVRLTNTFNDELWLGAANHVELLNSFGTKLLLSGAYVRTRPGDELEDLDVEGSSESISAGISHPFVRSRAQNLAIMARFDLLNSENDVLRQSLGEDRVRAARLTAIYDFVDRFEGVNLALVEVSQGLDVFRATPDRDKASFGEATDDTFTKLSGRVSRLQRIGLGFNVLGQVAGQYTFDGLLASEEFSFGGEDFGRGYDPAEIIGDDAVAGLAELQWGRAFGLPYFDGVQLFASYDYGAVWQRSTIGDRRQTASSAAIGARLNITSWLSARVMGALPLTRPATIDHEHGNNNKSPRFFFGVSARY